MRAIATVLYIIIIMTSTSATKPMVAASVKQHITSQPQQTTNAHATGITSGDLHTCAFNNTGIAKCWGSNGYSQIGDRTFTNRLTPVDVIVLNGSFKSLAAGGAHTCVIMGTGGVKCWGYNGYGQLGDGTTTDRTAPVDVVGLSGDVIALAAGQYHTCAVTSTGGVKCWGYNGYGQLGDGTTTDRSAPVDVVSLNNDTTTISTGPRHTCAIPSAGGVKCWGYNNSGQIGDGTRGVNRLTPVAVTDLDGVMTALAAGTAHTCAVTSIGGVKCWGDNYSGQIGDGTIGTGAMRLKPVDVVGLASGITALSAGEAHSCGVTSAGGVKCWGDNFWCQRGDGTCGVEASRLTPVDVVGLGARIVAIDAGSRHTCARTSAGGVKCWGYNYYGQLGDGTTTISNPTPVNVVGFDESATGSWTLMYYLAVDNDTETGLSTQLLRLAKAQQAVSGVNIVALADGNRCWGSSTCQSGPNSRYYRFQDGLPQISLPPDCQSVNMCELNTGSPSTLREFVQWSQANAPADRYALIIYGHGSGVSGLALDQKNKEYDGGDPDLDQLSLAEVRQALDGLIKLDVLFAYACLMATIEAGYEWRSIAEYYVASEQLMWGESVGDTPLDWFVSGGVKSSYTIPAMTDSTEASDLAKAMAMAYKAYAESRFRPATVSVARLAYAQAVYDKVTLFAQQLREVMASARTPLENEVIKGGELTFFDSNDNGLQDLGDELIDLSHFASLVMDKIGDDNPGIRLSATEVMAAIDEYIIYNNTGSAFFPRIYDHSQARGVSVFFPQRSRSFYRQGYLMFCDGTIWFVNVSNTPQELAQTSSGGWGRMVVDYVQSVNPTTVDDPTPPPLIAPLRAQERVFLPYVKK